MPHKILVYFFLRYLLTQIERINTTNQNIIQMERKNEKLNEHTNFYFQIRLLRKVYDQERLR